MNEFNQGAYDAFLSSIADLTSRDLVRKKLRKFYMDYLMNEQGLSEEEAEEVLYGLSNERAGT